jgi:O-antigen/teichoic acid export membrane protein
VIDKVKTYGALVFTLFLVFVLCGALIRWVTGSVWASNIGGLVAVVLYLWVGRRLWLERHSGER